MAPVGESVGLALEDALLAARVLASTATSGLLNQLERVH